MPTMYKTGNMARELGPGRPAGRIERVDSAAAENIIAWGRAVKRGANPEKQVALWAVDGDFAGIALQGPGGDVLNQQYLQYQAVPVLRRGSVWVEVVQAVTAGGAVYIDDATGKFRADATGGTAVPNAEYKTSAAANGLAIVELNLP